MDTPMIDIHLTIDEVLQKWPHSYPVFLKNKTKCVGCYMQRFCTLKDVAEIHEIPLEKLIDDLEHLSE